MLNEINKPTIDLLLYLLHRSDLSDIRSVNFLRYMDFYDIVLMSTIRISNCYKNNILIKKNKKYDNKNPKS